jgi:hypothetical protein
MSFKIRLLSMKHKLTTINFLFLAIWCALSLYIFQSVFYIQPRWVNDTVVLNYIYDENNGLYFNADESAINNQVYLVSGNSVSEFNRDLIAPNSSWIDRFTTSDLQQQKAYLSHTARSSVTRNHLAADLLFAKNKVCMDLDNKVMVLTDEWCSWSERDAKIEYDIKPGPFTNLWHIELDWPNQPPVPAILSFANFALSSSPDCDYTKALLRANKKSQLSVGGVTAQLSKHLIGRHIADACHTVIGMKFYEQQETQFVEFDFMAQKLRLY